MVSFSLISYRISADITVVLVSAFKIKSGTREVPIYRLKVLQNFEVQAGTRVADTSVLVLEDVTPCRWVKSSDVPKEGECSKLFCFCIPC